MTTRRKRAAAVVAAMAGPLPLCGERVSHANRCLKPFHPYVVIDADGKTRIAPVLCQTCYVLASKRYSEYVAHLIEAGTVKLLRRNSRLWRENFFWTLPPQQ